MHLFEKLWTQALESLNYRSFSLQHTWAEAPKTQGRQNKPAVHEPDKAAQESLAQRPGELTADCRISLPSGNWAASFLTFSNSLILAFMSMLLYNNPEHLGLLSGSQPIK